MLKTVPTPTTSTEQLLTALVASLKMLLVSLALIVVIVALFARSLLSIAVVLLTACSCLASWIIGFVALSDDVRSFATFLSEVK